LANSHLLCIVDFTANKLIGPIRLVTRFARYIRIEDFTQSLELGKGEARRPSSCVPENLRWPKIDAAGAPTGKVGPDSARCGPV